MKSCGSGFETSSGSGSMGSSSGYGSTGFDPQPLDDVSGLLLIFKILLKKKKNQDDILIIITVWFALKGNV